MITINTLQPRGIKVLLAAILRARTHTHRVINLVTGNAITSVWNSVFTRKFWVAGWWTAMISRGQTVRIPTHARERARRLTRTHTH